MLISHNLHDIFQVADRIVVMRLGSVVADLVTGQVRPDDVVAAITGARGVAWLEPIIEEFAAGRANPGLAESER